MGGVGVQIFRIVTVVHVFDTVPYFQVSLVMRKPVFGVQDQVRLKPACSATEASQSLEISDIETRDIILSS